MTGASTRPANEAADMGPPRDAPASGRHVRKHLNGDKVGRMAVSGKEDFKRKVRLSMRQLQNDPKKILSFYQKPSLQYAAC